MPDKLSQDPQNHKPHKRSAERDTDTLTSLHERRVSRVRTRVLLILIVIMSAILALPLAVEPNKAGRAIDDLEKLTAPAKLPASERSSLSDFKELAAETSIKAEDLPEKDTYSDTPSPLQTATPEPADEKATPYPTHDEAAKLLTDPALNQLTQALTSTGITPLLAKQLAPLVVAQSKKSKLDPFLAAAIIMTESSFNPTARSNQGKIGLMQISPSRENEILKLSGIKTGPKTELEQPEYNLELGLWYIGFLLHFYNGNLDDALAAYHLGIKPYASIKSAGEALPQPTVRYLESIKKYYQAWQAAPPPHTPDVVTGASPATTPADQKHDASFIQHWLQPVVLPDAEKADLAQLVLSQSRKHDLDAALVCAVIMSESSFIPQVVSSTGRIGLLQLDPNHAEKLAADFSLPWQGTEQLKDPSYNLTLGLTHLKRMLDKYPNDQELALLSFNLGEDSAGRIKRGEIPMPQLTARYLQNIRNYHLQWSSSAETSAVTTGPDT